ncbi:TPA: sugar ABC transporter permease [bacterium]|nr:sugar ABC transporter permease [bacterium]
MAIQKVNQVPYKTKYHTTIRLMRQNIGMYLLILLPLIYLTIFHYVPMYGVIISFKNFKPVLGIVGSEWIGLYHFQRFFNQTRFWMILKNTFTLSLYSLIAGFPLPIILALSLNSCHFPKLKKITQTVSYVPHFISTVVFVGIINIFFAPSLGLFSQILNKIGIIEGPLMTLLEKSAFPHLYVWSGIWQGLGWNSIIYIAALSGVDPSIHEAALVDGANKFQRVRHIDIPSIVPTIVILLILNCGSILNLGFEKIFLMQNSMNAEVSEVISTYVYKVGLLDVQYSYAAAIGLCNSIVNFIMLISVDRITKLLGQRGLF